MTSLLFEPFLLAGLDLRNRVAMAPMTRARALPDGTPVPLMADYYEQRWEAGLIVSEATNISPVAQGFPRVPGIFNDSHVNAWREVTDRVHRHGTAFFMQLWHVGRISHPDNMTPGLHPVGPSALAHDRNVVTPTGMQPTPIPRVLTTQEVRDTIADYAGAARLAIDGGCDGVEIHAANGYLPSQFMHETTNQRSDAYGGSLENRARFVIETTEACVAAIGATRVGIRFTPFSVFNGATSSDEKELYRYLLGALSKLGLAYVHVVSAVIAGNQTIAPVEGVEVPDAIGFTRSLWSQSLIASGDYDLERADMDLRMGRADIIGFGRDFIGNPDLVTRLQKGYPIVPRNPGDWYGVSGQGYTSYERWVEPVQPS